MPTLIQTLNGTVSGLWGGVALVRGPDGKVRVLQLGDKVAKGDVIITTQDGIVELTPDQALQVAAAPPSTDADSELDRIIAEVDNPTADTAPAAGLSAGDGGGLQAGLRVDRVAEGTTPAALLPTDYAAAPITQPVAASETQPEPEQPAPPLEVTLTASASTVAEGGSLTFTATVATPVTGAPLVLTLTNGATVTIPVGETSGTSAPILVRPDDVQAQGSQAIEVGVAGATGGNGAGLTPTPSVRADVIDDTDVTSLTLTSSSSTVGEGGSVVFTVALNAPVAGSPLVITLSNGQTVTIPVGASVGSSTPFLVRQDDVSAQGNEAVSVQVTGTAGGQFEALGAAPSVALTVTDTPTATTVTLSASSSSVSEGGSVVYTATTSNPVAGSPLVLTLSNGLTVTIPVGASTGTSAPFPVRGDDAYVQGSETVTVGVSSASGGDFEATSFTTASTLVADQVSTTTVALSASSSTVTEGGSLTYTATVSSPVTGSPLVVTLTNGQTITIPVGQSSATGAAFAVRPDDVQQQGNQVLSVGVSGTSGGNFEAILPTATASTLVSDNADSTTLSLSASAATVAEGGSVVYTATLSNPVAGSPLVLTLSNGQTITIPVGSSTGSTSPFSVREDDAYRQGTDTLNVAVTNQTGGRFEGLTLTSTAQTAVTDDGDQAVVTVSASSTSVAEGGSIAYTVSVNAPVTGSPFVVTLSNGQTLTIPVGESTVTGVPVAVRPDDAQAQGVETIAVSIANSAGGNFEAVSATSTATTTVSDNVANTTLVLSASTSSVAEGGSVIYTATLNNPVAGAPLVLTLSNGQTITIPVGASTGATSPFLVRADDAYVQGTDTLNVSVATQTGGTFEGLTVTSTAQTAVTDDADQAIVTVSASSTSVAEGGSIVYTVNVNAPVTGSPFVVTLSNGQVLTIPIDQSSVTGSPVAVRPDDAQAQGDETIAVSIANTSGGNFEAVDTTSTASTTVTDQIANTTLVLSASTGSVAEGGSVIYTAALNNPVAGAPLVLTLSNGQTITIPVGASTGATSPFLVRADDAYVQGTDTLNVSVATQTGGTFEGLTVTSTEQTAVTDDADQAIVTVSASSTSVAEGGSIVYTVNVNAPVTGSPFVVTLSNGQVLTIPVDQSSVTGSPVAVRPDDAQAQGDEQIAVSIANTSGGNFEAVDATSTASTIVTDQIANTTLVLSASTGSVAEGGSIIYTATLNNPVAGAPLVLTLSNGQTITIPVGASTGATSPFLVRADDAYVQGTDTLNVSVATQTGGTFEGLTVTSTAQTAVTDDADQAIVTVSASSTSVAEGGSIVYTVNVNAPVTGSPFVVTLSNGQVLTIPIDQSSVTGSPVAVRPDDAQAQGDETIAVSIANTSGGNFEAVDTTSTASTTVTDQIANTTLVLSASTDSVAEGGSVIYTATLNNAVAGSPLVLTLSNGQTITIPVGQSSGSSAAFNVRADDAYVQGNQTLDVTVASRTGGAFEAVTNTSSASTTVTDDADAAIITVTPSATSVVEGGSISYTVAVSAPVTGSPLVVTLSNGQVLTIPVNQSSVTGTPVAVRPDDVQAQGNQTVAVSINSTSGGNYEAVTATSTASTLVSDNTDSTTLTLTTSASSVAEGGSIIYTATLNNAVAGSPLVLTLSNGQTITIPVGESSGSSAAFNVRGDDAYVQGTDTLNVTVASRTGGAFEAITNTSSASTTVTDDADAAIITVTPSATSVVEGGSISYTVAVSAPVTGSPLVVTLSNGQVLTIPVNQSSVTGTPVAVRPDDVQAQGNQTVAVSINSTSGGNYEAVTATSSASTVVTDDADSTALTLTASTSSVAEGGSIVYTATLNNAVAGSPLVLTLSNGQTITIPVGQSSGSSAAFNVRADDAYVQGNQTLDVTVASRTGGAFEAVTTTSSASTTVTDDADAAIITVTPSATSVVEGGSISYTVAVSAPVTGSPLVVTLSNGQVLTIPVDQSSVTGTPVAVRPDDVQAQGNQTVAVSINSTSGGNYEAVTATSSASTIVSDNVDSTTLTLTASTSSVAEGGSIIYTATLNNAVAGSPLVLTLSNGQTITIPVGESSGNSAAFNVRADDAYVQGDQKLDVTVASRTGGAFEAITTTSSASTTVTDDADAAIITVTPSATSVLEGGSISYTVAVSAPVTGSPLVVTLSNGQVLTIPVGDSTVTGSPVGVRPDDAQAQGDEKVTVSITTTSGGNFEAVNATSVASTTVTDEVVNTTLVLSASTGSVAEGGSVIYTATLNNPVASAPLVLTLSNGQTITIPVGESTGATSPFLVRADDAYVQGTDTLTVSVTNQTGGTFEGLTVTSTATTTVADDADAAIITVTPSATSVVEGGSISYTVAVSAPVTGSPLVVTLSNGQVLTIPVNQSSVTGTPVAVRPDDVQAQGNQTVAVSINSTSGGNYEAVTATSTASTLVSDNTDSTALTLTASASSVAEGGSIIYTATLNNAVAGSPLVLTLSNGQTITIPVGESSGSSAAFNVRADDAYVQGDQTLDVTVATRTGGTFEAITTTSSASTTVTDDADDAIITVTPSATSVVEGGSISYTVAVSAPVTGSPLVVTLSNGQVLTIPVNQSSVTGTPVAVRPDDVQAQGNQTVAVSINSTSGGNYEAVTATSTASTVVSDDADSTTIALTASASSVAEGGSIIYTATLNNAVAGSPLVLTLSNGQTITIPVGQSSGSSAAFNVRADDAYVQGDQKLDVTVATRTGGTFEAITTTSSASTTVTDDADAAIITVTPSTTSVVEGGSISYTVAVSAPVTGSPLVVTLSNGQVLTIPVNQSSVTGAPVAVRPDDVQSQGNQTVAVSINSTSGGNYEAVTATSSASTVVTDDADSTALTLTASTSSVAEGGSIVYTATLNNAVAGSPLVLTLSNGQTITIPVGQSSGSSAAFNVRADDAYVQGDQKLDVTVASRTGGAFEAVTTTSSASTTVTDDADAAIITVTPSATSVVEGGSISYTVAVSAPVTGSPLVVTLSNGQVLTIPVNQSSVTGAPVAVRPDDVQAQGNQTVAVSINSTSGGNYEAVTATSSASTVVTDDADSTTLTLTASTSSVAEGGSIIYTATLNNAVAGSPLVLTLSNGQTITIPVGQSSGSSAAFNVRADDAYVQGDQKLDVTVTSRTGGAFEAVTTTSSASTTVTDDADAAIITVTPSATSVVEGGSISYTVAVSAPVTGSPLVVTLSNGQVLTIPVNQSFVTGTPVAVRPDDVQAQGNQTVAVSINSTSGGNYEAVTATSTASTVVSDDADSTALTLTASTSSVAEGGSIIYTATLNNPVAVAPLILTLSNGQTITIPVGQSSGSSAAFNVRADDAYVQGNQTINVTVASRTGGAFEAITNTSSATTTVTDDADAAVITVTPSATSVIEGGSISYTVAVSTPVTGSSLVVTLSNGQVLTIPVNQSSVTGTPIAVRPDDVQAQGNQTVAVSINSTSGGNYEAVTATSTASTVVSDDADSTTIALTASASSVAEGGSIIYTATLNNAVAGSPLVLTLSNGQTITIPVGQSSGSSAAFNVRADDAYVQGNQTLDVTVASRTGGTFEAITTTSSASTTVTDDADAAVITVTPSATSVVEGGSISYTVAVSAPVTGSPLVVTLSNGQVLTIPVNQSSVTGTPVAVRPDDVQAQGNQTVAVSINSTSGGNYEAVTATSTASTVVSDDADSTTIALTASASSVAEGGSIIYTATLNNAVAGSPLVLTLSNGQTITIPVGQSSGSSAAFNVRADDAYVQGDQKLDVTVASRTGGAFEAITTTSSASTTVTDDADAAIITVTPSATSVLEGGSISYTVAVSAPVTGSPLVVTLSNGQVLTIPVNQSSVTGAPVAVRPDDVQAQGNQTVAVSINSTSGGNYEAVTATSSASTVVTDDADSTTLTLTASTSSVAEGGSIIYTATLNNAVAGSPLVLTLSNGQTITIPVGQSSGSSAAFNVRADDAYVQGADTLNVTVSGRSGGSFEAVTNTSSATTTVTDDADAAVITVTPSATSVVEGGSISYTVAVSAPVTGSPLVVTLSNGQVLTIPVNQSSVTGTPVAVRPDDVQAQGNQTVAVSINSTSGGNYEAVTATSTASTVVSDDADSTTIALTASASSVAEGGSIIYTATLNNAVAGSPLVLTLSNGQTITIPVGQSSGSSGAFNVRADDAYVQGNQTIDVTVASRTGGAFEAVTNTSSASTTVTDDADAAIITVTPSATSVVEGGSISYTVAVSAPVTGSPLVVTLSNGQVLTVPVNQSSVTGSPVAVRPDDVQAQGNQTVAVSVNSTSGGNYEAVTATSSASTVVTDDADSTTLTLTASASSVAEGGSIIYTATLNNAVADSPLVLTLSNGQTITIPVGQSSGSSAAFNVRADDAYVQGNQTLDVTVASRTGGTFEAVTTTSSASTTVTDDADAGIITVTPSATSVVEGGSISYTVAVSAPVTGSPLVVTLSNGQVLTIPVNQSSVTGAPVAVRPDDVQAQGNQTVAVSINSTSGGNYEAVTATSSASTVVTDDADSTTITLTASASSIAEGGSIVYTATLNNAVAGSPLVLTLSNGQTITIPAGQSSGSSTPFNVRGDDAYIQGNQTLNVTVSGRSGGTFEAITNTSSATTTVTDDADAAIITVTPSATSVVEGGSISYTVAVSAPVTGAPLVVTLSNGQVLTIPVNQSSVTGAPVAVRPDDVQAQGNQTVAVSVTSTTGGNYEAVTATSSASTIVTDDADSTTITLTASASSIAEGGSIVYTATLNNAVAGSPLVLTLSNGQTITIPVGQSSGSSTPFNVRGDDAYIQGNQTLNVTVSGRSGGTFEAVTNISSATTTVTDDADAAVITVTPSATSVVEGGSISYTVAVSALVTGSPLVVTLSNGQVLTIPVNQSSVTGAPVAVRPDDVQAQGNQTVAVSINSTSGGNYEAVTATSSASTVVTDDADSTTLTLTASASSVAEGGSIIYTATLNNAVAGSPLVLTLSNGQTITIPVGQSSGSSAAFNVRADDAYVQGNQTLDVTVASRTGGAFEAVTNTSSASTTVTDDADAAIITVTPSATSVVEGGSISYTVAVSAPVTGSPLVVTLSNGQVLTIPVDQSSVTGTPVAVRPDDVQAQGNQTVAVSINSTTGGNYEAVTATSSASTVVTDNADSTTLTLTASTSSVAEGGSIVYTATLNNAVAGSPLVLTLSNGQTITIPVGQSSGNSTPFNVRGDDAYIQGNQTLNVTVSGRSGGTFEAITTTSSATTTVTDDADAAVITVTPSATSVIEGGSISYTVAVSAPVTGSPLVVTLSNGQVLTIPVNQSSVTGAPVAVRPDDVQAQGNQTVAVSINSTSGGNYEAVTATSSASTIVTDDSDVTTVSLTAASGSVTEGASASYTLTLSAPSTSPVTVAINYGGTASGADYTAVTNVTIPAGASSYTFTLPVVADGRDEADETLTVSIGTITGTGGFEAIAASPTFNTVTTTLVDADPTPALSISDVTVNEGATSATFTVTLSAESGRTVTVNYGTANDTAVAGSDFTSTTGTVTFAPGQTTMTITVPLVHDSIVESTETFRVNLTGAVNATLADATGIATIIDNDSAPVIDLDANNSSGAPGANYAVTFTEGQSGAGVRIVDTDMSITDADSTLLTSATITLTNRQPGDALNLGNDVSGISVNALNTSTTVTLTLTGTATLADYLQRIQNITFVNDSEDPSTAPRTVTVQVNDGNNTSNLATTTVNVVSVNDLPEGRDITISTAEDTARPFTLADFRLNDLEDGSNASPAAVRFDTLPTNGTLYVGGIAATAGQVVTAAQISAGAVTYAPNANDHGNGYAALTFSVRDSDGGFDAAPNTVTVNVTPVSDGAPVAAADAFRTTLGTPITITQAQLLANDILRDDARITGVSAVSGGTLVNNNNGTYTFTPTTTGNATFSYTLTDTDGQTSTASVTVNTVIARDDLATVHESALASGTGGGDLVAAGTLMANDGGGTVINNIVHNGTTYSAENGVITVDSALGRLVVQASGANAGSYTYTLETNANNSAAGNDLAVTEVFQYTSNAGVTASLRVNVVDDMPVVTDHDIAVSQVPLPSYNLVLVLDISGSMTTADYGGQVRRVNADGTSSVTTRLTMAKEALVQLVEQYYNQSQSVAIKIVTFSDGASILNNNNAFTSLAATVAAINGITGTTSGGTNYQAALDAARSAYGTVNTSVSNATYFLSDGAPSTGNTTTALNTYGNFIAANGIDSYGVGIGTGISSTDALDAIHNVDGDGDGTRDAAVIVPDLNQLGASLLSTVPPAFGGNLVGTTGSAVGSVLGADGGQVLNITVKLDSNGDGVPDRDVTFTYNASTNQISQNSTFLTGFPKSGDMLTLGSSTGFGKGTLIFNFSTGSYTYYTNGTAAEGDNFTLTFQARDGDGDLTPTTNLNFVVTNGAPIARPDTDTLQINETRLEGNVITGAGTDAGLALGTQVASFSQRGDGVDTAVDNAEVTSLQFQGRSFDLTTNSSGSGVGYTFVINNGQLTWTGSGANAGSVLVFNSSGYYNYTPPSAALTGTPHDAAVTNQLSATGSANSNGVSVTAVGRPGATGVAVNYANTGAGVSNSGSSANTLGDLERLVFTFSTVTHPYGVQNVSFSINAGASNLGPGTGALIGVIGALTYTVFDVTGQQIGQFYSSGENTVTLPSEYGNIGRIEVEANSVAEARISNISFESINLDNTAPAVAPVEIGYTLTDDDGQSSTSTLTLGAISNNIYGTSGAETLTGTAANDRLVGLAGNDILRGGEGHDTLEGGDGSDRLEGGAGHDRLLGGDGADRLEGGAGNDVLSGGRGNDVLVGGDGADVFRWEFAEQGVNGTPSIDTVTDFNVLPASAGGDVLDLRDLLQGETAAGAATGNLTSYLHFDTVDGSTTIQISTSGGFSGGYNAGAVDQSITLQGVDLTASGALNTDQQIIQDLLNKSKLVVDGGM